MHENNVLQQLYNDFYRVTICQRDLEKSVASKNLFIYSEALANMPITLNLFPYADINGDITEEYSVTVSSPLYFASSEECFQFVAALEAAIDIVTRTKDAVHRLIASSNS